MAMAYEVYGYLRKLQMLSLLEYGLDVAKTHEIMSLSFGNLLPITLDKMSRGKIMLFT